MTLITQIATKLRGRAVGNRALVCCPVHNDSTPSLSVTQIAPGMILAHCHAGCAQGDVIKSLKDLGLWPEFERRYDHRPIPKPDMDGDDITRVSAARQIWASTRPVAGTVAESYLRARKISCQIPEKLRYAELMHGPSRQKLPALVSAIETNDGVVAVHRTFIDASGTKKADVTPNKMCAGVLMDGAARLFSPTGNWLGIAEGIETALSAAEIYDLPVWAACGARLHNIAVPEHVKGIVVFADNGAPGAAIAKKAVDHFSNQGLECSVVMPPEEFDDFNTQIKWMRGAA